MQLYLSKAFQLNVCDAEEITRKQQYWTYKDMNTTKTPLIIVSETEINFFFWMEDLKTP